MPDDRADDPVSLDPLDPLEALKALLAVDPDSEPADDEKDSGSATEDDAETD